MNIQQEYNLIKQAYNQQQYEIIYSKLSTNTQTLCSYSNFVAQLIQVQNCNGNIIYDYINEHSQNPTIFIVFQKSLSVGYIYWTYQDDGFNSFLICDLDHPSFLNYLIDNNQKLAISIIQNDQQILSHNSTRQQPLQSTFKITIAIEFARQISNGELDKKQMIDIQELNKFYIEQFDNGHIGFLTNAKQRDLIINNQISLYDIAIGMIEFSSNCNTEYLQTILTLDKIHQTIKQINLQETKQEYLVSSQIQYIYNGSNDEIHQQLINRQLDEILSQGYKKLLSSEIIQKMSLLTPYSTTYQYCNLMYQLSQNKYFDSQTCEEIHSILGCVPKKDKNQLITFDRIGVKGGSVSFPGVSNCQLTMASYSKFRNQDNAIAICFMLQNLSFEEFQKISKQYNLFCAMIIYNQEFKNDVINKLSNQSQPIMKQDISNI